MKIYTEKIIINYDRSQPGQLHKELSNGDCPCQKIGAEMK